MKDIGTNRIQISFYALALFNLGSIALTLWVTKAILGNFHEAVLHNRAWTTRLGSYTELNQSASRANAPGNDVFDTRDVAAESARLDRAVAEFRHLLGAARDDLRRGGLGGADDGREALLEDLDALEQRMNGMVGEAHTIFSLFRQQDVAGAGARMATMDREYARVQTAGRALERRVHAMQTVALERQAATAGAFQRYHLLVSGLLGLVVVAMVLWGRAAGAALRRSVAAVSAAEQRSRGLLGQIEERNRDLRLILDNVDQGFVTLTPEGHCSKERSQILDRWFGPHRDGVPLWECLRPRAPHFATVFEASFGALRMNPLLEDLLVEQLPRRATIGNRHLALRYQLVAQEGQAQDGGKRLLLVVTDVTDEFARALAEQEQQTLLALVQRLLQDRDSVIGFRLQMTQLVRRVLDGGADGPGLQLRRDLHTLKGNASCFGATYLSSLCHEIEGRLAEEGGGLTRAEHEELAGRWERIDRHLLALVPAENRPRIALSEGDLTDLLSRIQEGATHQELAAQVQRLCLQPLDQQLWPLAHQIRDLTQRLNKCPVDVSIVCRDIHVPRARWRGFLGTLTHLVRNAVDHGLETEEERASTGKGPRAKISFTSWMEDGVLVLEMRDDGRGIDRQRVGEKAARLGLPAGDLSGDEALLNVLCTDGFSTRDDSTEYSGRGVGLSVVRSECEQLGGVMMVRSELGLGTSFSFRFPAHGQGLATRRSQWHSLPTHALPA